MAVLIDKTYFVRKINLPGAVLDGALQTISEYITVYEKELMINLLGYGLYKEYVAARDLGTPYDSKIWNYLILGNEYEVAYGGKTATVRWHGLINSDKVSMLAYYIYYQYMKANASFTSIAGQVLSMTENSKSVSPAQSMADAYNACMELYGRPGHDSIIKPTAYNLLLHYEDDATYGFDNWIFTPMERVNTFGI